MDCNDSILPPYLGEINKGELLEGKIEVNARISPIRVDCSEIQATPLTTVPNSPVTSIKSNEKPQSNPKVPNSDNTNLFPINLSGPSKIPSKTMDGMEAQKEDKGDKGISALTTRERALIKMFVEP